MQRIDIDKDDVRWDDGQRLIHKGKPFTGQAASYGWTGEVASLVTYLDGLEDGLIQTWYENGQLKSESIVHHGIVQSPAREWHENGQLSQETYFDKSGVCTGERQWDDKGTPAPN